MRGKRSKQYRKLMHKYALTFGFREPYQVLLDAAIMQDMSRFHMDVVSGLEKTLHGKVKPMITQCSMRHLYKAGDQSLIAKAKDFERRRCGHHELDEPLSTLECFKTVVDPKTNNANKHRYVGAIQDPEVRAYLRSIPGVPLVYINRSVMIMEPMAEATEQFKSREERQKFRSGLKDRSLGKRKRDDDEEDKQDAGDDETSAADKEKAPTPKKKSKGLKGPNPLSMRKPKSRELAQAAANPTKPEREEPKVRPSQPAEVATSDGHRRKRVRKPSTWKKEIVEKVLAHRAELTAGAG